MPLPEKGEWDPAYYPPTKRNLTEWTAKIPECDDCSAYLNAGIPTLPKWEHRVNCAILNAQVGRNFESEEAKINEIRDRVRELKERVGIKDCEPMKKAEEILEKGFQ